MKALLATIVFLLLLTCNVLMQANLDHEDDLWLLEDEIIELEEDL